MEELDRLLRDGVTAEELNQAREGYLAGDEGRSFERWRAGRLVGQPASPRPHDALGG
jgi:hypothetical protein